MSDQQEQKEQPHTWELFKLKYLDHTNTKKFLYQNPLIKDIVPEEELDAMEIDGSDLSDKKLEKHLRKYWRIKDKEKRKIIYDYIQENKPCKLEVYTLEELCKLNSDQAKDFLL